MTSTRIALPRTNSRAELFSESDVRRIFTLKKWFFIGTLFFSWSFMVLPLFAERWNPAQGTCKANIQAIESAIEMFNMSEKTPFDSGNFLKSLKTLVDKKYLAAYPKCPGAFFDIIVRLPPFPYFLWTSSEVFKVNIPAEIPEYRIQEKTGKICCNAHGTVDEIKDREKEYTDQFISQLRWKGSLIGLFAAVVVLLPLLWFFKRKRA